eukprot:2854704-Prymnesium_polylepis.2
MTTSPFISLLGDTLLTKDGEKPTAEVLADKEAVGLYFSGHWVRAGVRADALSIVTCSAVIHIRSPARSAARAAA